MAKNIIRIETRNFGKVANRFKNTNFKRMQTSNMDKYGKLLLRIIKDEAPKDTGKGAQQMSVKRAGENQWEIIEGAPWMIFPRLGVKPHPIYPRVKKALWWPGAGAPRLMVNHPGQKKNPYPERAIDRAKGEQRRLLSQFEGEVREVIEG